MSQKIPNFDFAILIIVLCSLLAVLIGALGFIFVADGDMSGWYMVGSSIVLFWMVAILQMLRVIARAQFILSSKNTPPSIEL